MSEIVRLVTNARRGRAVAHNGILYIGGQAAGDRHVGIQGQMEQVLASIDRILAEAGTDRRRLLTVQIWMRDIGADFAGMNEAWDAWIDPTSAPARATCQCELGAPDVLVEVIATAAMLDQPC